MGILLVGLSYKTAPIAIRDCLAFTSTTLRSALTHFGVAHREARLDSVYEGVILSTCNRLEVYAFVHDPDLAVKAITKFLACSANVDQEFFVPYLEIYQDRQAVAHLLRVAAGLESMVLGEAQILGQISEAYQSALSQKAAATVFSPLFRAAIHTGKRVRTETAIGANPTSVSAVAVRYASQIVGDLSRRRVLLIGAGEMGAIAIRALKKRGVTDIIVTNRTYKKAARLAQEWGGQAIAFQQLSTIIAEVDIIITSTSAPHTILDREIVEPTVVARTGRPLLVVDLAVPRDVDPNIAELPHVYLLNIDDLQGQVDEYLQEREKEIEPATRIVNEEVDKFLNWFSSLGAVSTISQLRQKMEQLRQSELDRLFNRLDLSDREQDLIATMSHRLVNKMLHTPTIALKKETAKGNGMVYIATTRHLFSLDSNARE